MSIKNNENIEYHRQYFEENKDYILEKVTCIVCNIPYTRSNKCSHENTSSHKKNEKIANLEAEIVRLNEIIILQENIIKKNKR